MINIPELYVLISKKKNKIINKLYLKIIKKEENLIKTYYKLFV